MKKKKQLASIIAVVGVLAILTSFESHRHGSMAQLANKDHPFVRKTEGITVMAKSYTAEESGTYLNRNLLASGYQPIQVTVQNHTPHTYSLGTTGASLPTAHPNKVALSVSKKALPRAIGLRVASFFFWPFTIPSTIDGIITLKSHMQMRKDYTAKSVKESEEKILPYSTCHRMLFVPKKEVRDTLTITLFDQEEGEYLSFINPVDQDLGATVLDPVS